jgi:hypothetical protein
MNNELIGIISNEGELKGVIEDDSFNVIVQITDSGPRGPQGLKGDTGERGLQGPQGIQGEIGPQGPTGKSIEYNWNGTQLGVRVEGTTEYVYVDLKGEKGETGEQGPPGPKGDTPTSFPAAGVIEDEGHVFLTANQKSALLSFKENFVHNQLLAAAVWNITHNLGKYPSVTVVDSAGTVVVGEIEYLDLNSIRITFTAEFSGKAYFN